MDPIIETDFKLAIKYIKDAPKSVNIGDLQKLEFYKYYKQAIEGDNNTPKPGTFPIREKFKWEAWKSLCGMSKCDAMKTYISLLTKHKKNWKEDAAVLKITV